ncbi:hypothetical protein ACFQX6_25700 [Streptosporangium lutulentum]
MSSSGQAPPREISPTSGSLPPVPAAASGGRFSINLRQSGIYIAFALIIVLFSIVTGGELLKPQNISNIIVQNSYILILAIGMILIIIATTSTCRWDRWWRSPAR